MYDRTYVTLNISSTSVRLLSVEGGKVGKWGSVPLPPGLVRNGLILRPKVVGAMIDALFKSTGVPKKRVIASLTGLSFIHRVLSLPRVERASQSEAIQRAARQEMPLPLEELRLGWQAISDGPDEVDFFVLGVPRNLIEALSQTLGEAGIQPYLVDVNPLALARAANREEAIIIDLEPECFDIVLVANGMPTIMHTIAPRGEGATLEDNIRLLVNELSKTVEFYNSNHLQNPLSPTTPLLLTGELAANTNPIELILAEMGYPVESLTPPLALPSDLPAALFATNIGLALKKLPLKSVNRGKATRFRDINLNMVSGEFRAEARWVKLPHILLSLVVLTGLVLLFPMDQVRSRADTETARLQTELTQVNQELDQALLLVNEAEQIEDSIDKMVADAEAAKQRYQHIMGRGGDFAHNLELVTDAFPVEAYFTSVDKGNEQITVEGEADNSFTVVDYVMALEALEEYSEVRIVRIDESKINGDGTGVSFRIIITK
jgi:Tfp pilus assembly PilM family ATPase/Tfp pilus assembly protein PilN